MVVTGARVSKARAWALAGGGGTFNKSDEVYQSS